MRTLSLFQACLIVVAGMMSAMGSYADEAVTVTPTMEFPANGQWMHAFDATKGESGETNATLARAVAFHRHLEKAGVDPKSIKTAVVVHGMAIYDISNAARYEEAYGAGVTNPNAEIVAELMDRGAEIWVCGVAAVSRGVGDDDILPGVQMSPAAMVAHAELQRRGFSLNPY